MRLQHLLLSHLRSLLLIRLLFGALFDCLFCSFLSGLLAILCGNLLNLSGFNLSGFSNLLSVFINLLKILLPLFLCILVLLSLFFYSGIRLLSSDDGAGEESRLREHLLDGLYFLVLSGTKLHGLLAEDVAVVHSIEPVLALALDVSL